MKVKFKLPRRKKRTPRVYAWARVKKACIVVLLICNVLLLAVSVCVRGYDRIREHQTRQWIDGMLGERDVLCGSSVYQQIKDCPAAYSIRTDSTVQRAFAEALLGKKITVGAEKGNTMVWSGEVGSVSWAASGDVTAYAELHSELEPQSTEQAQDLVEKLLRRTGITVKQDQFNAVSGGGSAQQESYTVEVSQEMNGVPLLGCTLKFVIDTGNRVTVSGKWCTGEAKPLRVRALEHYSPPQMIFQLLAAHPVAEIISAQPVYVLSDKSGGRFTVIPCWRFSTDDGDFVLNILTAEVIASSDIENGVTKKTPDSDPERPELDDSFNEDADTGVPAEELPAEDTQEQPAETDTGMPAADAGQTPDMTWNNPAPQ